MSNGAQQTNDTANVEAGTLQDVSGPPEWPHRLEARLGLEARGLERVPASERADKIRISDYVQMGLIWFSSNATLNNLALGLLGPTVFQLGLKDAIFLGVFGILVGSAGTAYISTFGPLSGCRTLVSGIGKHTVTTYADTPQVVARYTMGWWPAKICAALNIVIMLGYGLVDCLLAGQTLSAVANNSISVIVGTIIASMISLIVALVGIKAFHIYERYAGIPQVLMLFILIGVAGPKFNAGSQSLGMVKPSLPIASVSSSW